MALRAGVKWGEFLELTPFITSCIVAADTEVRVDAHEAALLIAFSQAHLIAIGTHSPKDMPTRFEDWIGKPKPIKPQTDKEFKSSLLIWARRNGLEEPPE